MHVFLINMKQSDQRLAHMTAMFGGLGIDFERFEAINARDMTDAEIARAVAPAAEMERALLPSEIGCFLSHQAIWRIGIDLDLPWLAVFEDDIHLAKDAGEVLKTAEGWMPADADIVKLETVFKRISVSRKALPVSDERRLKRLRSEHWGTAGYIVTRKGMDRLLSASDRVTEPVDMFMFPQNATLSGGLVTYQMDPAICVQDQCLPADDPRRVEILSDIVAEKNAANRRVPPKNLKALGLAGYIEQKLKRRTRKALEPVRQCMTGGERKRIPFQPSLNES